MCFFLKSIVLFLSNISADILMLSRWRKTTRTFPPPLTARWATSARAEVTRLYTDTRARAQRRTLKMHVRNRGSCCHLYGKQLWQLVGAPYDGIRSYCCRNLQHLFWCMLLFLYMFFFFIWVVPSHVTCISEVDIILFIPLQLYTGRMLRSTFTIFEVPGFEVQA